MAPVKPAHPVEPALSVQSLGKSYPSRREEKNAGKVRALYRCSLEAEKQSFTAIVGRSGCGKTTLLKLIAALEKPDEGQVVFSGGETDGGKAPKIGFMFQDHRLLPWLTVEQNLALAFPPPGNREEKEKVRAEIQKKLALAGLEERARSYPRELSGGMAQRAALARCLCRNPEILLLDEPLGSLDAFTRTKLREELDRLWQKLGLTVILVTHDIEEAVYLGGRVLLMEGGAVRSETAIALERPRDYHSGEFQEYCRTIEGGLAVSGLADSVRADSGQSLDGRAVERETI